MPTSSSTDFEESLPGGIRVSSTAGSVELYFPAGRSPEAALALGAFGVVCGGLSAFALLGLIPPGGPATYDLLVIVLVGAFIAPFVFFGLVFIGLAVYMLANSLTVAIGNGAIVTIRRVFGLPLEKRSMRCADVREIESQIPSRYQSLFSAEPRYRLVARSDAAGPGALVIAEDLRGEYLMARIKAAVERAAGVNDPTGIGT